MRYLERGLQLWLVAKKLHAAILLWGAKGDHAVPKDGPPISSGYRYGALNAFRANLPSSAIHPRGQITATDAGARKALSDFASYPLRAKSIGVPLPAAQAVSARRAAALKRIEELERQENTPRSVTLTEDNRYRLKLLFDGTNKLFRFRQEDLALGLYRNSLPYGTRKQAMMYYRMDAIRWYRNGWLRMPEE